MCPKQVHPSGLLSLRLYPWQTSYTKRWPSNMHRHHETYAKYWTVMAQQPKTHANHEWAAASATEWMKTWLWQQWTRELAKETSIQIQARMELDLASTPTRTVANQEPSLNQLSEYSEQRAPAGASFICCTRIPPLPPDPHPCKERTSSTSF